MATTSNIKSKEGRDFKMAKSSADVVIRGGFVISPYASPYSCLVIRNGKIDEIVPSSGSIPQGKLEIDARNKLVLPGVIDVHVHVNTPGPEDKALGAFSDSFDSLSQSAACGGVTTIIPHVYSSRVAEPENYVAECRRLAEKESVVDFGFSFGLIQESDLKVIPNITKMGIISFKSMMARDRQHAMVTDDLFLEIMEAIRQQGGFLMVHAEDGAIISFLETRLGRRDHPARYLETRPPVAERLAIQRILALGEVTKCPVYIVHLSTQEGLEVVRSAKERGQRVFVETCPKYLFLTDENVRNLDLLGPLGMVKPPLRKEHDIAALWGGINDGTIDLIGSDHAPRTKEGKLKGLVDFFTAPFGSPGVETMLPVLFDGLRSRNLPLTLLVKLLCEEPARIFGVFPRKGVIACGADADIVVFDPECLWTISPDILHTRADYSVYTGRKVRGKPVTTLVRGEPVMLDGKFCGKPGWGKFLARPLALW